MASEWTAKTFENGPLKILDGDRGKNYPSRNEFTDHGHCVFLNTGNVTTDGFKFESVDFISDERDRLLRKGKLQREDVVLTTRGTVGNAAYFDDRIHFDHIRINSGMVILRPSVEDLEPRFLYLFVRSHLFSEQVASLTSGSAQPQLPIRDLKKVEIPLPPLPEQKAIAHILGTLDDKIELNRRMNETLEHMAQALFKSWFVDFDPVMDNALAAGNPIPDELVERAEVRRKGLADGKADRESAMLFPDAFRESEEMGWIPEGWEVKQIRDLGSVVCGNTPKKSNPDYYGDTIPFIKIPDMHHTTWITDTNDGLSLEGASSQSNKEIPANSICVSCIATVGKVIITSRVSHTNQQINSLVPYSEAFRYYLYFTFLQMTKELHDLASGGSATLNLNSRNFSKINILYPSMDVLELYTSSIDQQFMKMLANDIQSNSLIKLRNILLPKLISGELRIMDAMKMVETA